MSTTETAGPPRTPHGDLAVVGAGPAGLAAAVAAAERGLAVVVVDAGTQPGGQYWRHPDEQAEAGLGPHADAEELPAHPVGQHDWQVYVRLRERFDALRSAGAIAHVPGAQVWFVERTGGAEREGWRLRTSPTVEPDDRVPAEVTATALVLCPGGYDRQLPVAGWDLPGVMAAGGVQALLKGHGSLAGRRAVVAGTGPFLLPVAAGLAEAGAEVLGVCEANAVTGWARQLGGAAQSPRKGLDAVGYVRTMLAHRIPYRQRTVVTAIGGRDQVESVTTARLGRDGTVVPGSERTAAVDLVALGWGFTPSLELVTAVGADTRVDVDDSLVAVVDDDQRSTVPGVYVAGEATGVGGAALALLEGELAGLAAAADLGRDTSPIGSRRLRGGIRRGRAFARAMHRAHPVPATWTSWLTPETLVCRCEEVDVATVRRARDELGGGDFRTAKLLTRTGMGWCQGRVCGFATALLAAEDAGRGLTVEDLRPTSKRTLGTPLSLGRLADLAEVPAGQIPLDLEPSDPADR
ncbi:(2Fe-2S)-binding protein [Microlunatus flavus]|uniref:NADP-dependent aldehyde dehydrogenase n=1 Tax=Microlunatus flavus TaxID=1036181 RepID=A0A1H9HJI5_9ACTN|nr:(2Fe-2S)-binding protein [Microlunatus flavus]SEQ62402.1 NADP-dependent aldehyde dehydrogenase [Microlunatus flavus]